MVSHDYILNRFSYILNRFSVNRYIILFRNFTNPGNWIIKVLTQIVFVYYTLRLKYIHIIHIVINTITF